MRNFSSLNIQQTLMCLLAFATVSAIGNLGQAQQKQWKTIEIDKSYTLEDTDLLEGQELRDAKTRNSETKRRLNEDRKGMLDHLKGDARPANFDRYLRSYVMAQMTQTDQESLSQLGSFRSSFLKTYLGSKVAQTSRDPLIGVIVPEFIKIASEDYHPAVRHNAVMILGQVDSRAEDRLASIPPTPSAQAQQFLRTVLLSDNSPDFLKVAAFAGIQRAIAIESARGRAPTGKAQLAPEMLAIAQGNGKGSDKWSPDLKYWMQRRAVQCLGLMKDPGGQGQVIDTLKDLLKDPSRDQLWVQLDAVQALDQMPVNANNGKGICHAIGGFLARALRDEGIELKASLEDLIRRNIIFADTDLLSKQASGNRQGRRGDNLSTGGGGGDMEGPDEGGQNRGTPGQEEEVPKVEAGNYRINISRRRAKVISFVVKKAYKREGSLLRAVSNSDEGEREFIKTLVEIADKVIEDTNIGIRDLDAKEDEESTPGDKARPYTLQISEALIAHSKTLNGSLPEAFKLKDNTKPADAEAQPVDAKPAEAPAVEGKPSN